MSKYSPVKCMATPWATRDRFLTGAGIFRLYSPPYADKHCHWSSLVWNGIGVKCCLKLIAHLDLVQRSHV